LGQVQNTGFAGNEFAGVLDQAKPLRGELKAGSSEPGFFTAAACAIDPTWVGGWRPGVGRFKKKKTSWFHIPLANFRLIRQDETKMDPVDWAQRPRPVGVVRKNFVGGLESWLHMQLMLGSSLWGPNKAGSFGPGFFTWRDHV